MKQCRINCHCLLTPCSLHDIYDVVQIAKQLISSGVCTQNEDPDKYPRAGFSMSTRHTHQYCTQEKHQNICKRISGICDPFLLLKSSSGFQDFVFIFGPPLYFSEKMSRLTFPVYILQMPAKILQNFVDSNTFFLPRWSFGLVVFFTSKNILWYLYSVPKVIHDPDVFFSSSNEWNEWHVYAYVCVSAYVYVYLSLCMHTCMCCVCLYLYMHIYQRIQ